MEYHIGAFASFYIKGDNIFFFVIACDKEDSRPSFYGKSLPNSSEFESQIKYFRSGSLVFFTSEDRTIIDIININQIFSNNGQFINDDCNLNYNGYVLQGVVRNKYYIISNKGEILIYKALFRAYLLSEISNSINSITSDKLRNIISEEEKAVSLFDIRDILSDLSIHHICEASCRTDKEDSLHVGIGRSLCKYQYKIDSYLNKYLKIGENTVLFHDKGWFNADEEAEEIIANNPIDEESIKRELIENYSQKEHVDYRVRENLNKNVYNKLALMASLPWFDEISYMLSRGFVRHFESDTGIDDPFVLKEFDKALNSLNSWFDKRKKSLYYTWIC